MDLGEEPESLWLALAGLVPLGAAAVLVPVRDLVDNTNLALMLVVVIVAVAVAGGRAAGAVAAVIAAMSFDFFLTRPYLRLTIDSQDDIETTVLLLTVGLVVGHIAARGRVARRRARTSAGEIRRLHRVAELVASGQPTEDVIATAQDELADLLRLRACQFEAPPFLETYMRMERSGVVPNIDLRIGPDGIALPFEGVELPVMGRGHLLGRFVLKPTVNTRASLEERVVAVAIADQVGGALAAPLGPSTAEGNSVTKGVRNG